MNAGSGASLPTVQWEDFARIDLRVGTIVEAEVFEEARKPALRLRVDLGAELGIKRSSAQITHYYEPAELLGRQVLCVTNFPPLQIGPLMSEVLVTGLIEESGGVVLVSPERPVPNGTRLA